MKKCPACDKTYEDSMRFCQIDGTPLVDDVPFDPFATIVGVPQPKTDAAPESSSPPAESGNEVSAISEPDDVLDLPDADPLRTMYVSDAEMKDALRSDSGIPEPDIVDVPPVSDISSEETLVNETESSPRTGGVPEPEAPSFDVPDVPAPSFGDMSPPPSPFSPGSGSDIPMAHPSFDEPSTGASQFNEAQTMIQGEYTNPFEAQPTSKVDEWTPPAPAASWENQQMAAEPSYTPMSTAVASGQNKTLAIISLVTGILGLTICCGGILPSVAAIVTGIMARNKASQNPSEYGGSGMAMAGIITGALGLLGGIVVLIFWLLGAFANMATGNF